MSDPITIHRRELSQRLQTLSDQGGWEGTHTDYKEQLRAAPKDYAKLLKHILAFANTPRRTDAYIIFGVAERKNEGMFAHVGVASDEFPPHETIESLLQEYTSLRDVVVDANYVVGGKRTPYIVIPLQYEGPYYLTRAMKGAGTGVQPGVIYSRYGSSSLRASARDERRMRTDWEGWFLDCRYERNATSLIGRLAAHFPKHRSLLEKDGYVRLLYESAVTDEFGLHRVPVLVHAYWGFDQLEPPVVDIILGEQAESGSQRIIIGARFASATREVAAAAKVRCISLDDLYFVNDPYAQLCRAFVQLWSGERDTQQRGIIIDLDYSLTSERSDRPEPPQTSVLSFIEDQLQIGRNSTVVVHGGFGAGKTTTAKQLAASLAEDYLRSSGDVPKVLYVDVNNLDLGSTRDECIERQLLRYRLSRELTDRIIQLVREDHVHLLFDGVDEMAKPHTATGRADALELLKEIGNHRTTVYLIRSSYYPQLDKMIADFGRIAEVDFSTGERSVIAAEIRALRSDQVGAYLESRLGVDNTRLVRTELNSMGMASFLEDPLIISLVAQVVEGGIEAIESFSAKKKKALFLSQLVDTLLRREQKKRSRHGLDFALFQNVLRTVAFRMVSEGIARLDPDRFDTIIRTALGPYGDLVGMVDAFRTVSWIHRRDDGSLSFRHEALTVVCAAKHICTCLENRDLSALREWQATTSLADVVYDYAGEMVSSKGILGATSLLDSDIPADVRHLIVGVLRASQGRVDLELFGAELEFRQLASIVRGMARFPHLAKPALSILLKSLSSRRILEVGIPLLSLLSSNQSPDATALAIQVLELVSGKTRNFAEVIREIKSDQGTLLDRLMLKELGVSERLLLDSVKYEALFKTLKTSDLSDPKLKHYAERTLSAIDGEKQRREDRAKSASKQRRPRSS